MGMHAAIGDDRTLRRIAELLVALAVLAERGCGRSFALRCLILWLLRPAEACARNFVIGEAPRGAFAGLPAPISAGGSFAGLMRLAACFRALALAVRTLSRQPHGPARRRTRLRIVLRHLARLVPGEAGGLAIAALRPLDTS